MIPARYDVVKKDIVDHLHSAVAQASFTTDGWTASNNTAYTGVMLNYIDRTFNVVNKVLAIRHTPGSHTAKVLASHTIDILEEF